MRPSRRAARGHKRSAAVISHIANNREEVPCGASRVSVHTRRGHVGSGPAQSHPISLSTDEEDHSGRSTDMIFRRPMATAKRVLPASRLALLRTGELHSHKIEK
jgi:hypothetical protein